MSQVQVPPVVLGGHVHTSRGHVTTSKAYIPTSRMYVPTSGAYIPTYRVSHGTSHTMIMDPIMGCSMDRVLHLMGAGINNPLTLQIMSL